ncbi:MAG: M1 family metallopeptidase, partial [Bacteroidales bacterium]|nr:M1 family metallopeptidase [Bacteroidales bacterium]
QVSFTFRLLRTETDSIVFWTPDLVFEDVLIPGIDIKFSKKDDNLIIFILSGNKLQKDVEYQIEMKYRSKPKYDLFFIGWNEPAIRDNKQIWAHRPFHWLPYYGDRLTADMYITFDGKYKVMTNGVRESVQDNPDGTKTWHYKMAKEHPFFSTCLVVGDYKFLELKTKAGLPLELWYYSWQEDHAEPTYRYTAQMFDFFNEEFGLDYPYELYREAPVEDYLYGAMETTTATVFGDYLAVDDRAFDGRNYVNVNAHELAHQWFGNCLSHQKNSDVWLTESFATYYAKRFEKEVFGDDYYQWVRSVELDETLEASKKDPFPIGNSRGGRARWYPKGSLVLDMMRDILGDEGFKAAISRYANQNAFSEVETAELRAAVYEATGQPIDWFFDQWILRGGEPHYEVSWIPGKSAEGADQTIIRVRQAHQRNELTGLFKMPITFEVYYDDGSSDRKIKWIEQEYSEVLIPKPTGKSVSFILFDPGRKILKTVSFSKTFEEWTAQALLATGMIDRYDALVALRGYPVEKKEATLMEAWSKETYHLTRSEILNQLFGESGKFCADIFLQALRDQDPLVRRAALVSIEQVPENMKSETEKLLTDHSYINVEKALDLLSRSFPHDIPRYLETTKNETGWRGRNIRMKWLEIAIQVEQREYLREITDYAGPGYEFETRINAFYLLKRLNYLDKKAAANLIDGYLYWNYKVSNAAKEVLVYFYQQNKYKSIIDNAINESRLSLSDKVKVEKMLAGNK